MNIPLAVAGILAALLGLAHSILGERLLLGPLFRKDRLPKLLGSTTFARRVLRFAWHLTTVLLVAIGVLVAVLSTAPIQPQTLWVLRVFSVTFFVCFLVSLIGGRAKHFSWYVFLIISALLWYGAS